ncbi:MAG: glycosyltransferase, partial [Bacteroidetes bacterium]|nr:glycosyltransferase [Bacteroidota bacterium]
MQSDKPTNIILPVPENIIRPRWSVMIPTFNPKEHFMIAAINSALIQDPGAEEMQIEVVDDCSTKVDVEKIVNDNWKGRVNYYRLPKNVGHSFNFTECVRRSKGELVHLLHDDDKVKPGFYSAMDKIFRKYDNIGAAFCRQEYIDDDDVFMFYSEPEMEETGILENALVKLAEKQRIQYCSIAVKRKVYEQIGGYIPKNIGCEDWEMWVRIAAHFQIGYEPQALAQYRIHRTSMTLTDMRTGQDMRFLREAADIFTQYLPEDKREEVTLFRNKHYSVYSFNNAKRMYEEFKDEEGAAAQLSETIKLDPEIVYSNLNFLRQLKLPVESAGVSVVVVTENDKNLIAGTIKSLTEQVVYDYIPWEIIVIDTGSSNGTLNIVKDKLLKSGDKISYWIIESDKKDYFEIYKTAFENAKYDTLIFCNPGELLNDNYISRASENILKYNEAGVIGGYSESRSNIIPPAWFNDKNKKYYQTGEQYEYSADITWSKGFVWGSGMVFKKDAWNSLLKNNFTPFFTGSQDKTGKASFEKELCYALRSAGWKIVYNVELVLTKFIPDNELRWSYLRKLLRRKGTESAILSAYKKTGGRDVKNLFSVRKPSDVRRNLISTFRNLKKIKSWKSESYKETLKGDTDILKIEYFFARLKELTKLYGSYNRNLRLFKKYGNKKDLRFLNYILGSSYFRYPHYNLKNNRNGVSVIFSYRKTSSDFLFRSLFKICDQKLPPEFPYELIFTGRSITQDLKTEIFRFCSRINPAAKITFFEIESQDSASSFKKIISSCRFKNLLFLNELTFISADYIGSAFNIFNKKKKYAFIAGQQELTCDVKPPKWFGSAKKYFGDVKYTDVPQDITGQIINRDLAGILARKDAALMLLTSDDLINDNTADEFLNVSKAELLKNRIISSGFKIWYEPGLKLKKLIPVKYLSNEFLNKINYQSGDELLISDSAKSGGVAEIKTLRKKHKGIFISKESGNGHSKNFTSILDEKGIVNSGGNGLAVKNIQGTGVSVVVCCYNSSKVLPKTLRYLLSQKVPDSVPWEIIIVDNASTDNTSEIAKEILSGSFCKVPFTIVKEPEPGLSAARLKGINTAKYGYIVFCDDDNRLQEDFVKICYDTMESNKEIGVLGG